MLTTALVKSDRFVVLERAVMGKVTAEQDFAAGGRANTDTSAKMDKIIGAKAIITGDLTEFSYSATSAR
jgi:curli biogenesis system outer membrane secretion channel CsgG